VGERGWGKAGIAIGVLFISFALVLVLLMNIRDVGNSSASAILLTPAFANCKILRAFIAKHHNLRFLLINIAAA
jgi:hypothetical protein